jgi:hypothetical protein
MNGKKVSILNFYLGKECVSVVEHLSKIHEALGMITVTAKEFYLKELIGSLVTNFFLACLRS